MVRGDFVKNPLNKRFLRELKGDAGKYIALFLFLIITIGFCSGFLVAGGSLKQAYDDSFEKYNIENGHFTLNTEADDDTIEKIEENGITVYELFHKDSMLENEHTVRIYKIREEVNKSDLMEGEYPNMNGEIAIDRLYAENNGLSIGDVLTVRDTDFRICGLVALSDYSALFKNNTDMMFDANKFTVALVTDEAFESLGDSGLQYTYAWINDDSSLNDSEQKNKADDLKYEIAKIAVITDFVSRQDNMAIQFTGDDMGGDQVMMQWLLYIVMAVMAFAFSVTTRSTVEQEASAIGTLRASGYTRGELLRHYITLPLLMTLVAAIIGNILGYTVFKGVVADVYYRSYSLPTYVTIWNPKAFLLTTLVPCIIILVVNLLVLSATLSLPPLQFLRHEFKKNKKKKVMRLPNWGFMTRFRTRVITQNFPTYLTLFAGILLSSALLMFGIMFSPLLQNFKIEVQESKIANYQYILKGQLPTDTEGAEKYAVTALQNDYEEEITVYGLSENSRYLTDLEFEKDEIYLSDGYMEKYGIKIGDEITLSEKYDGDQYTFTIAGIYHYPATMSVFMSRDTFANIFDKTDDYFTGYFSDEKITDIDEAYIASTITEADLTIMADQLEDSMGLVFGYFGGFATILFLLMIYLLAKIIIDKNSKSISMLKILGYTDKEAGSLYNMATGIVVAVSILISIPICHYIIKWIYYVMMLEYNGWLTYYIAPWVYPVMFAIGFACYIVVHFIELKKIRRIPLAEALKNME